MREIGGYIEFEHYHGKMLHEDAVKLNCGRSALACLIEARGIRKLSLPYFCCDTVARVCQRYDVQLRFFSIDSDWMPLLDAVAEDEWLYIVNPYGQLSDEVVLGLQERFGRVIVDQTQAYFAEPLPEVDTLYSCRKFFGVADGALLYTSAGSIRDYAFDESYDRMGFLLGRFERSASEFYSQYVDNNAFFANEPIRRMSKLTENILHSLDYDRIARIREDNFTYLQERFQLENKLQLHLPKGPFMYPLYVSNGMVVRKKLQERKIYIPLLWPEVLDVCASASFEYDLAANILPLPIDQRYGRAEMKYVADEVFRCLK